MFSPSWSMAAVGFILCTCYAGGVVAQQADLTGEQLCFEKGDWERGLPLLAQGTDVALGELARGELENPTTLAAQVQLADEWSKLAESSPAKHRATIRSRAIFWYRRALTQAKGAERTPLIQAVDRLTLAIAVDDGDDPWKIPPTFAGRDLPARKKLLETRGGSDETEQAVAKAIDWILKQQAADGSWSLQPSRGKKFDDPGTVIQASNAATALALLPLLGQGQTHVVGEHKRAVKAGLDHLLGKSKRAGRTLDWTDAGGTMYSHALVTLVVVEAYALTGDEMLRQPAQASIAFIVEAQHPAGGWRYKPREAGDSSVTAWQVQALVAAKHAGLDVPDATLLKAGEFTRSLQHGRFYGYTHPTGGSLGTTAACELVLATLPRSASDPPGRLFTSGLPPDSDAYHNLFSQTLNVHSDFKNKDGWNKRLVKQLLESQVGHNDDRGSWYFRGDLHASSGGRLYCTSLATLMLEAYYRHVTLAPEYKVTKSMK